MKKALKKTNTFRPKGRLYYHKILDFFIRSDRIEGPSPRMKGDCSELYGDCTFISGDGTGVRGDCTGLMGSLTGLSGDLDECEITEADRASGIQIGELVGEE